MRKQILKTASIVAVGIILSATPVFAKTQVNVIVVDGKNTSSTSDDTYYHLKVTKGKKLSNATINRVKIWANHDTNGRGKVTKLAYNPVVPVAIKSKFNSNTRLKLIYKQIKPIVTFYDSISKNTFCTRVGQIGKTVKFPAAPSHLGYQFVGWKGLNEKQKLTKVAKYKVTAMFKKLETSIVFDGNGAQNPNAMSSVTLKNTTQYKLPKNIFKKDGCTFIGWNVLGKIRQAGETITVPTDVSSVIVTAVWQTNDAYTIKYMLDGGYFNTENVITSYMVDTPSFTLPIPEKSGCIFVGWTGADLKQTTRTVTINQGSTGNRSYYAVWKYDPTGRSLGDWQLATFSGGQNTGFTTWNVPLIPHHSCSMSYELAHRYGLTEGDKIQISTTGEIFTIDEIPRTSFNSLYYISDYKEIALCVYPNELYNDKYNVVTEVFRVE